MTLKEEVYASDLEEKTWDCEDFWNVISDQDLYGELDNYLNNYFPDGADIEEVNDLLRHEGEDVLNALGANLTGTIWDEDSSDEEDENL